MKKIDIEVKCEEVIGISTRHNMVSLVIENPIINDLLVSIGKDKILEWVAEEGFSPDELCTNEQLHEWAEDNGYTK